MQWSALLGALAIGGTIAASACGASSYACEQSSECSDGTRAGTCEPTGWCSFPDDGCASGARYGELAGAGFAGECVTVPGTTDASTSEPTSTSSDGGSASSSVDATATATSDPTEDTATPICGDGSPEGAEACDDGNQTVGDGCSPECQLSGSVVWEVAITGTSTSRSDSMDLFANGDLAVGFVLDAEVESVPGAWRLSPEGRIVWEWAYPESPWISGWTWGLDIAEVPDGELVALAIEGTDDTGLLSGVAAIDGSGNTLWTRFEDDRVLLVSSADSGGGVSVAGYAPGIDAGLFTSYLPNGQPAGTQYGEPLAPEDGFVYDLLQSPAGTYTSGTRGNANDAQSAFLGITTNGRTSRYSFAPGTQNQGLAVAFDPVLSRGWIAGYAGGVGGWVAAIDVEGLVLDATIVTNVFPANLDGIAVDSTGAVVAVGWDSAQGTRDGYVVKVAPDGSRIWSTTFVTPAGDDNLRDVAIAADGGVFVTGTRANDDGTSWGWVARLVP